MAGIDSPEEFWDGDEASGGQIDAILAFYKSPLVGQGELIARVARQESVNPVLLLAIMQEETEFGRGNGGDSKEEWTSNPFAVHFNERGRGISKLRTPSGELSSFEGSLRAAIRLLKQAGEHSSTPLASAAREFQSDNPTHWARSVAFRFQRLERHI